MAELGRNKLTATRVRAITEPRRHSDGGGLYLVVKPSGTKSWSFMWKVRGKRCEMGLGAFPAVSLAKARALADAHRGAVAAGRDPLAEKRRGTEPTFEETAALLISGMEAGWRNPKHRQQWRNTLATYCPSISGKPVGSVGTDDVLAVLQPIWLAKPETASRVRGRIERILDFAKARGWRDGPNPALWRGHLSLMLPARAKLGRSHHDAMPYRDVPAFLVALKAREAVARLALEFTVLTASRTSEVIGATWTELDLERGVWTVPAGRMKAGREHRVPLGPAVLAVLGQMTGSRDDEAPGGGFLFPGQKTRKPLSNMAMETVLRRMGRKDGVTVHGFRSAFRDWAGEETAFPRELAEAALAHTVGDATERAYRRGDALEKRRALMLAWESYCGCPPRISSRSLTDKAADPASVMR